MYRFIVELKGNLFFYIYADKYNIYKFEDVEAMEIKTHLGFWLDGKLIFFIDYDDVLEVGKDE